MKQKFIFIEPTSVLSSQHSPSSSTLQVEIFQNGVCFSIHSGRGCQRDWSYSHPGCQSLPSLPIVSTVSSSSRSSLLLLLSTSTPENVADTERNLVATKCKILPIFQYVCTARKKENDKTRHWWKCSDQCFQTRFSQNTATTRAAVSLAIFHQQSKL